MLAYAVYAALNAVLYSMRCRYGKGSTSHFILAMFSNWRTVKASPTPGARALSREVWQAILHAPASDHVL
jgi:hypothetical protein